MTTPITWRPSSGADSVPLPDDAKLEGPVGSAAYSRYLIECQEAARRETADEAIVRCRAEADLFDDGGQRFDNVLACLLNSFDGHAADLVGPEGYLWDGYTFDECSYYASWQVDQLQRAHAEMSEAYRALDRERFRKAAATFAEVIADFGIGLKPTSDATAAGGAR